MLSRLQFHFYHPSTIIILCRCRCAHFIFIIDFLRTKKESTSKIKLFTDTHTSQVMSPKICTFRFRCLFFVSSKRETFTYINAGSCISSTRFIHSVVLPLCGVLNCYGNALQLRNIKHECASVMTVSFYFCAVLHTNFLCTLTQIHVPRAQVGHLKLCGTEMEWLVTHLELDDLKKFFAFVFVDHLVAFICPFDGWDTNILLCKLKWKCLFSSLMYLMLCKFLFYVQTFIIHPSILHGYWF